MKAKELQVLSAYIKKVLDEQGTEINPEFELVNGVLWCIDEIEDRQLFIAAAPTTLGIKLEFRNWCDTVGIMPF